MKTIMSHLKRASLIIPAIAVMACLSAASSAQAAFTPLQTETIDTKRTNWNDSVTLDKFDPSLGTLIGVEIMLGGHVQGTIKLGNLSPEVNTITGTLQSTITLSNPADPTTPLVVILPADSRGGTFLGLPENSDPIYVSPYGGTWTDPYKDASKTESYTDALILALFTGPGTIALPVSAKGTSYYTDEAGNAASSFTSFAGATVSLRYEYISAVPEPSSVMLVGMGGLGLLAANRRRKTRVA